MAGSGNPLTAPPRTLASMLYASPNLTSLPFFGPILGAVGFDGVPQPDTAPEAWRRGTLAPVEKNTVTGQMRPAVPQTLYDMLSAVEAPGKALAGQYPLVADQSGRVSYGGMDQDAAGLAELLTLGAGAVPKMPGTLGMGGAGVPTMARNVVSSFPQLRKAIEDNGGKLFVRWSKGPRYDLKAGAVSKDYQTGQSHEGLSAVELTNDLSDWYLYKMLRDYSHFAEGKGKGAKAHIYAGDVVGKDSDGAPSIRPKKYIGPLSPDFHEFVLDANNADRLSLLDQLETGEKALQFYASHPEELNSYYPYWTPERVRKARAELAALGHPSPKVVKGK